MKIRCLAILAFALLLFQSSMGQGIEFFEGSFEEAMKKAEIESKPLFIDAYAVWCGPCKKMARTTFMDPKVGEYMNAKFISMKIDMEKGEGIRFRQKYPVSSFPTLFFLDKNGELLKKDVGAKSSEQLIKLAEFVLSNIDYSKDFEKSYLAGNREPEFILDYVKSLNLSGKSSQVVSNEYFRDQKGKLDTTDLKILFESVNFVDSKLFERMELEMPRLQKLYSAEIINQKVVGAAQNTSARASEYKVIALKDESLAAVKKWAPKRAKEFEIVQNLEYYKQLREKDNYKNAAESFINYYFNKDNDKVYDICLECVQIFDKDAEFLDFAEKHLKKLSKKDEKGIYLQALAQVYFFKNDSSQALKYAGKAKKLFEENKQPTMSVDQLIRRIES